MARIILARNTHSGTERAEQLEPLIQKADVISFETANITKDGARRAEKAFSSVYGGQVRKMKKALTEMIRKEPFDGCVQYERHLHELIRKYGKRVALIEQLTEEQSQKAQQLCATHTAKSALALERFNEGDVNNASNLQLEGLVALIDNMQYRNQWICERSPEALVTARKRAGRDNFTYLIIIGGQHTIAQGLADATSLPVEDVYLPSGPYQHLCSKYTLIPAIIANTQGEHMSLLLGRHLAEALLRKALIFDKTLGAYGSTPSNAILPPPKNQDHLVCLFEDYVATPIAACVSSHLTDAQIRDLAGRRILRNRDNLERITSDCRDFLLSLGYDIPTTLDQKEKWSRIFPHDQAKPMTPARQVYSPQN